MSEPVTIACDHCDHPANCPLSGGSVNCLHWTYRAVGRCGAQMAGATIAKRDEDYRDVVFCSLPSGHDGWHRDGLTEWSLVSPSAAEGVWLAYYSDGSGCVPFATEIEALRHALPYSMAVKFVRYGDEDWRTRP